MRRNSYTPLREDHQKALDALNNHIEQGNTRAGQEAPAAERQIVRSEGSARQPLSWTAEGGMVQQQASANEWQKKADERMAALNRHIERGESGRGPDQSPDRGNDVSRKPDDIER